MTGHAEQANTFPKVHGSREGELAAVLLDMDGTLIEHTRDLYDLCRETFAAFEEELAPVTQESFWETFWPKNRDMWYMMLDGVLSGDVARLYFFVSTLLHAVLIDPRDKWTELEGEGVPRIRRLGELPPLLGLRESKHA